MRKRLYVWAALALIVTSGGLQARPVSYPGGWTALWFTDAIGDALWLHYSPTARYSVGFRAERNRDSDFVFYGGQYTRLLKRWNAPGSQANLYLNTGAGFAFDTEGDDFTPRGSALGSGFLGVQADWETRRWFASYDVRHLVIDGRPDQFVQKLRLGVAPYIAEVGDWHLWFMVEGAHRDENEDRFSVTPLLRLFKGPLLLEGGVSDRGEFLFNAIYRF